jgi:hypothetical protein
MQIPPDAHCRTLDGLAIKLGAYNNLYKRVGTKWRPMYKDDRVISRCEDAIRTGKLQVIKFEIKSGHEKKRDIKMDRILNALKEKPMTPEQLAKHLNISVYTAWDHTNKLSLKGKIIKGCLVVVS